jgi:hypothetical protein
MKYLIFFLIGFCCQAELVSAQLLLPNGSRFIVTSQTDNLVEYT